MVRFLGLIAGLVARVPRSMPLVRALLQRDHFARWGAKPFQRQLIVSRLNGRAVALANDAAVVESIMLTRAEDFPKSRSLEALLQPMIGKGVFAQPGGAQVREARRMFTAALAAIGDETVATRARERTRAYATRWLGARSVAICAELSRLTIDVVTECALGRTFSQEESGRFTELFFEYQRRCVPALLFLSGGRAELDVKLIRAMALEPIGREMRSLVEHRFMEAAHKDPAPFYAALRDAGLLTGDASPTQALDELMVLLLAGHETTASTLSWLFWQLASEPARQQEGAAATRKGDESAVRLLIDETLRLYPPIAFFAREAAADAEFRGKRLPRGSLAVVAPWTLHRHERYWQRAGEFLPDRWREAKPERTAYMPFGLGPRRCPGARFAATEMVAIVSEVLGRCRMQPAYAQDPQPFLGGLTARPRDEIHLRFLPAESR